MTDDAVTLTTFFTSWKAYQDRLAATLAPLTADQLTLRPVPGLRSIGETALHIVGCRMFWLIEVLGEDGGEELRAYTRWNEVALRTPGASLDEVAAALGVPSPTGAELAQGVERTWRFMEACLTRWGPSGLAETFPGEGDDGTPVEVPRAWVVWHVLEHDLHHGGELSLMLGMHGILAEFAV